MRPLLHGDNFFRRIEPGSDWPHMISGGRMDIKDDPVRPELSVRYRHSHGREVYANRLAVVCVAYCDGIPKTVKDLTKMAGIDNIVFYTVWSYEKGAGSTLVSSMQRHIKANQPWIKRCITLSPKTEMAHRFHIKNGAVVLQKNHLSVNYEYILV